MISNNFEIDQHHLSTIRQEKTNEQITLAGQTDIHFSKEGIYPSFWGYAMRKKAPFKEDIDKWFVKMP